MGRLLRIRYSEYLSEIYVPYLLEARSSNFDRTKASLFLVLAGLFPPIKEQIWNNEINWQPIPTIYEELSNDKVTINFFATKKIIYNTFLGIFWNIMYYFS